MADNSSPAGTFTRYSSPAGSSSPNGAELGELSPEEIEKLVDEHLAAQDVPFEVVECDPDLADTDAFCLNYRYAPEDAANTIVVVGKSDPPRFVACVLLTTTRLDVNHAVKDRLGVRKASFADREQTRKLTGMAIGGVTALALPPGMPIWVDSRVIHACSDRPRRR